MNPSGKIALVTGAAHGIGEATVRRLAGAGAIVVLADVDRTRGEALAAELGAPHRFLHLDVADENAWKDTIETVRRELGGLHILFLNAGVLARPLGAPAGDAAMKWFTPENYRRVSGINGDGVVYGVLYGFPLIRDSGGGLILATASTAAVDFYAGDPAYSYGKAGILALVKSLAAEFDADGVRICAICPGSIDTRIYPRDRRAERSGSNQSAPASPFYLANAVMTIVDLGGPGDIWVARPDDQGFWVYEPPRLPPSPISKQGIPDLRFVPATTDGATVEGTTVDDQAC